MSDKRPYHDTERTWLWSATFLIVMFWGEPDIADAIIHWLMKGTP